jgi:hypothetical protein
MKQTGQIFEVDIPSDTHTGITTPVEIEVGARGNVVVTISPFSDKPAVMTFDSAAHAEQSFSDLAKAISQCNTL